MPERIYKSIRVQKIETQIGEPIENYLKREYEKGAGQREIAKTLGMSPATVNKLLKQFYPERGVRLGPKEHAA